MSNCEKFTGHFCRSHGEARPDCCMAKNFTNRNFCPYRKRRKEKTAILKTRTGRDIGVEEFMTTFVTEDGTVLTYPTIG